MIYKENKSANNENMNKQLEFLIYNTPQGDMKIDVVVKDETVWLTQILRHSAKQISLRHCGTDRCRNWNQAN